MVAETLMATMGCIPILSIKVSVEKIKGAAHKNTVMMTVRVNESLVLAVWRFRWAAVTL